MTASPSYHRFFGVDMAKYNFVVAHETSRKTESFPNSNKGFEAFIARYSQELTEALVVVENTGGCEYAFIRFLLDKHIAVHRADARKVKAFIRSLGTLAKTDSIDAHGLCRYARERHVSLFCAQKEAPLLADLRSLIARRNDLVHIRTAEKNRLKSPENRLLRAEIEEHLAYLARKIAAYEEQVSELFRADPALRGQLEILQTIPGIGVITAQNLLAFLPEIGHLGRRQAASLLGVAPIAKDSGKFRGYRGTWGGRNHLRAKLFTAAMAAARSKSGFGGFYQNLVKRGKHKMVAIVALMRKIIVTANAKIRDYLRGKQNLTVVQNHS